MLSGGMLFFCILLGLVYLQIVGICGYIWVDRDIVGIVFYLRIENIDYGQGLKFELFEV